MPRLNKNEELKNWLFRKQCYAFKVIFSWEPANKTIGIISDSIEAAEKTVKENNKSAIEIIYLGSIDKIVC